MALIDPKMVPDEAAKAAWEYFDGYDMKEALAAALSAWPGAQIVEEREDMWAVYLEILPLSQEPRDE